MSDFDFAVDDVAQVRQRLDRDVERLERTDDGADDGRVGVGDREQDFVGARALDDDGQVAPGTEDRHAVDAPSRLVLVIVDEADRLVVGGAVALHVAHDQLAGAAGAEDEHALAGAHARELGEHPAREADAAEQQEQQERIDEENRSRIRHAEGAADDGPEQQRAGRDAADQRPQVVDARVTPEAFVQTEGHERDAAHEQQYRQHLPEGESRPGRHSAVESQGERRSIRDGDQQQLKKPEDLLL